MPIARVAAARQGSYNAAAMQFLRTLFWVVLAAIAVAFAFNNWRVVTVRLWTDLVLDTPLPVLLLIAFLLGLLPALALHRATRWSLRRKLDAVTRAQFAPPVASAPTHIDIAPVPTAPTAAPPLIRES